MTEHLEQAAIFHWARLNEERYPELALLFAVPNAGKRSIGAARYYLEEGLKAGIPDILLPIPEKPYIGLAIEMKVGRNKPTENQIWWLEHLQDYRWRTEVCYSADEAIAVIKDYLRIND